jgi:hypothetical protein
MKSKDEACHVLGNIPDLVNVSDLKVICCVFAECRVQLKQHFLSMRGTDKYRKTLGPETERFCICICEVYLSNLSRGIDYVNEGSCDPSPGKYYDKT